MKAAQKVMWDRFLVQYLNEAQVAWENNRLHHGRPSLAGGRAAWVCWSRTWSSLSCRSLASIWRSFSCSCSLRTSTKSVKALSGCDDGVSGASEGAPNGVVTVSSHGESRFKAVCDAVSEAWDGNGDTITGVAARFGVSRGWIHKWVYPALRDADPPKLEVVNETN